MDAAELADLKRDALRAVREVLDAPDAKPADRLRAAEVVARLEATRTGRIALHELGDLELLAIARGEGGTPRKGDPETPSAGAVPSDTDEHPNERIAKGDERIAKGDERTATSVPRETPPPADGEGPNPFLIRKKGPDGTQKGPAISGGPLAQIASEVRIGHDPEPWE
jgi:hypothetical protein